MTDKQLADAVRGVEDAEKKLELARVEGDAFDVQAGIARLAVAHKQKARAEESLKLEQAAMARDLTRAIDFDRYNELVAELAEVAPHLDDESLGAFGKALDELRSVFNPGRFNQLSPGVRMDRAEEALASVTRRDNGIKAQRTAIGAEIQRYFSHTVKQDPTGTHLLGLKTSLDRFYMSL